MFSLLTDAIDNALDVTDRLFSGEDIERRQVAKLLSDGISIATIASMTGVAIDVIKDMANEGH